MENPRFLIPFTGKAALLATACLLSPLYAGEPASTRPLAKSKTATLKSDAAEAHELLLKGDESYNAGRYADAVEAYAGARDLLPESPENTELRTAATERYTQASVQYGRELVRKGDLAGAKAVVDKVLLPSVSPNDPGARAFRADLDDPIRTNPALTAEHGKNTDQVRRLLYTAEGAYNLGAYDKAKSTYEDVLRIDPYNSAARRGMERVSAAKGDYQNAAYDHARAEMLAEVDKTWELPVAPLPVDPALLGPMGSSTDPTFMPVSRKLDRIVIPKVSLEQTTLSEAIDYLRAKINELGDTANLGGVNLNVNLGESEKANEIRNQKFDLQLSNVPVSQVIKYITDLTQTTYTTDDYSVIIQPFGSSSGVLNTRNFKVPPGFIATLSEGATAPEAAADPFANSTSGGSGGLLAKRLGPKEALTMQGITFPEGASVSYNAQANTLRVTNTEANLETIARIVETISQTEPVNVITRVTMIRTEQRNLEELGFDWTLSGAGLKENLSVSGGSQGNGGDLSDAVIFPAAGQQLGPITAGNRSGNTAIDSSSIDDFIAMGNARDMPINRAPGVFGIAGIFAGNEANMLMRGLSQKKGVDMMTSPSVVSRSGQAASVRAVREFIYPTEYEPPEVPQTISSTEIYVNGVYVGSEGNQSFPVTPANPTAFQKKEVGVVLEVLPTVDPTKNYVELVMKPSITDFDGFINYGSPINAPYDSGLMEVTKNSILQPVFSVQRIDIPTVNLRDGATIVVGGLLKKSLQNVEDKTPVLGDLPVVGRLFQSKASEPISTAIIFMVNVQIVDALGQPFHQPQE